MIGTKHFRTTSQSARLLGALALLALALYASPVAAEGGVQVVSVERLNGLGVGIQLVFPEGVSPGTYVSLNGKMMDCEVVAPQTLYCTGSLRPNETVTLSAGDAGGTQTFSITITGPQLNEPPDPLPAPEMLKEA